MQLLPPAVETVAAHRRIHTAVVFVVELFPVTAVVLVRFAHVLQFACDEFEDDDIVEVTDDRNIVRKNVFGIAEIHECGQNSFPVHHRQPPFLVAEHLQHRFQFGQPRRDEVGQGLTLANIVDDAADGIDDLCLVRTANDVT